MRVIFILLLTVFVAPAAFSQKMSGKPRLIVPNTLPPGFPDPVSLDILNQSLQKQKPRVQKPLVFPINTPPPTGDRMPNGFKGQGALLIHKNGDVYESTIDHMPVLMPVVMDNMPVRKGVPH